MISKNIFTIIRQRVKNLSRMYKEGLDRLVHILNNVSENGVGWRNISISETNRTLFKSIEIIF